MSLRLPLPLVIAALALTAPVAAHAGHANTTPFEARVSHGDLDLTTTGGIARLDGRVRTKARQMCQNGGRDSASVRLERECIQATLEATAPSVRLAINNARADQTRLAARKPAPAAATPRA